MSSFNEISVVPHEAALSVAIVCLDRHRRIAASNSFAQRDNVQIREFLEYPATLDESAHVMGRGFDVILIDLDEKQQFALDLVERLCIARSGIVMVFSANADQDLMVRSMRAGAREFFHPALRSKRRRQGSCVGFEPPSDSARN
jgi:DNA-binding NarL/FixJ family response regulator